MAIRRCIGRTGFSAVLPRSGAVSTGDARLHAGFLVRTAALVAAHTVGLFARIVVRRERSGM